MKKKKTKIKKIKRKYEGKNGKKIEEKKGEMKNVGQKLRRKS